MKNKIIGLIGLFVLAARLSPAPSGYTPPSGTTTLATTNNNGLMSSSQVLTLNSRAGTSEGRSLNFGNSANVFVGTFLDVNGTNAGSSANAVLTNGPVQFIYPVHIWTNGLQIGDGNFLTFNGGSTIRGNKSHSGGGSGGLEYEMELASQGSFSFTGGQDGQHAGSSHFGASLQSYEWWHMQYEFVPGTATSSDATTGLYGFSKPFGFALKGGDGTTIQQLSPAFRSEAASNDAVAVLRYYSHFGKPSGWNQLQLVGTPDSPGFLSSNSLQWRNIVSSNFVTASNVLAGKATIGTITAPTNINTPLLQATNFQVGNGLYTTSPVTPFLTIGYQTDTNIWFTQDAAATFDIYYNNGGTFRRMFELGARNGGTGTLRDTGGNISVDWQNHTLNGGNWNIGQNIVPQSNLGGATAINWAANNIYTTNLASSVTFTFTGNVDTMRLTVIIAGDASHTVTWPGTITWVGTPGRLAPTQTLSKTDVYNFIQAAGTIYGTAAQ